MFRKALVVLVIVGLLMLPDMVGCASGPEFPDGIFGTVFEDTNANGVQDDGEQGIKSVLVSNGIYCRSTNKEGEYNLPAEGSFLYITTPRNYSPTGQWYASISSSDPNFSLARTPEKDSSEFTFIQITDIHLDSNHVSAFNGLISELNEMAPAFVIATGDITVEGNGATVAEAEQAFNLYENAISKLTMPVHNAVGNHDVIGIHRTDVSSADPGYGEGTYTSHLGPTYYSFDWSKYHCIVLDPNDLVDGKQVYQISEPQLKWLKDDLKFRKGSPLLVFFHEPTASWKNRTEVLKALKGHSAKLFCGHLHQDIMTDATDVSEQITGAVSGEWWFGANPDGKPAGYSLVSVKDDAIDSLYKGTGDEWAIDTGLKPIVNGEVELAVKIYSRHGSISEASYQVDDDQLIAMTVGGGQPWAVATASWDTTSLSKGYHRITVKATDSAGSFQEQVKVKVSDTETVSVSDLTSNWDTYHGSYVSLEGTVAFTPLIGPSATSGIPEGIGILFITGGGDMAVVIAGDCFSPPLTDLKYQIRFNDQVIVKVVPLRLTMGFLTSTREYKDNFSMIADYVKSLPSSAKEKDVDGELVAVWGCRLLSADDATSLSR